MTHAADAAEVRPLQVEMNGINVIAESERKGRPRDLFWPWFAANVSVLGISYGAFVLGFGISFWQAVIVGAEPRFPATEMNPQARNESTIPIALTISACQNEMPKASTNAP